jgi:hypothetical protein
MKAHATTKTWSNSLYFDIDKNTFYRTLNPSINKGEYTYDGVTLTLKWFNQQEQKLNTIDGYVFKSSDTKISFEGLLPQTESDTPEPVKEPENTPEPVKEPEKTPEPVKEPVKTPEPVKEPVKTPEPVKEPVKTPEPVKEPVKTPEPVKEPENTPEPVKEPKNTPEPNDILESSKTLDSVELSKTSCDETNIEKEGMVDPEIVSEVDKFLEKSVSENLFLNHNNRYKKRGKSFK